MLRFGKFYGNQKIDRNLQWLREHIKEQPEVTITYFKPDETKNGGAYVTVTGSAKKVEKLLILRDGNVIPIPYIISSIIHIWK